MAGTSTAAAGADEYRPGGHRVPSAGQTGGCGPVEEGLMDADH